MCYHHFIWELYEVTSYILCELCVVTRFILCDLHDQHDLWVTCCSTFQTLWVLGRCVIHTALLVCMIHAVWCVVAWSILCELCIVVLSILCDIFCSTIHTVWLIWCSMISSVGANCFCMLCDICLSMIHTVWVICCGFIYTVCVTFCGMIHLVWHAVAWSILYDLLEHDLCCRSSML